MSHGKSQCSVVCVSTFRLTYKTWLFLHFRICFLLVVVIAVIAVVVVIFNIINLLVIIKR